MHVYIIYIQIYTNAYIYCSSPFIDKGSLATHFSVVGLWWDLLAADRDFLPSFWHTPVWLSHSRMPVSCWWTLGKFLGFCSSNNTVVTTFVMLPSLVLKAACCTFNRSWAPAARAVAGCWQHVGTWNSEVGSEGPGPRTLLLVRPVQLRPSPALTSSPSPRSGATMWPNWTPWAFWMQTWTPLYPQT